MTSVQKPLGFFFSISIGEIIGTLPASILKKTLNFIFLRFRLRFKFRFHNHHFSVSNLTELQSTYRSFIRLLYVDCSSVRLLTLKCWLWNCNLNLSLNLRNIKLSVFFSILAGSVPMISPILILKKKPSGFCTLVMMG